MFELDQEAKDAGITVLNEIGVSWSVSDLLSKRLEEKERRRERQGEADHLQLDPGIDHLYAVSVIERVHELGGKIKSFVSYCGGLTAPEGMTEIYEIDYLYIRLRSSFRFGQPIRLQVSKSTPLLRYYCS